MTQAVSAKPSSLPRPVADAIYFWRKTFNIFEMEMRKLRHDPLPLFTRAVQPLLWLVIFGQVLAATRAIPTGEFGYIAFMAPGVLAQSVLFISIFYGLSIIWERDLGIIHKFLASPAPRTSLVLGKGLSSGVRGLSQTFIIVPLAYFMGVKVNWSLLNLLGIFAVVVLGAVVFSTFSLLIAIWVKTRERFMGVGQFLTMPLFFASNAIYPIEVMPGWLQVVSRFNPLSYMVDALRTLMLTGSQSTFGLGVDFLVLSLVAAGLVWYAARKYPTFIT